MVMRLDFFPRIVGAGSGGRSALLFVAGSYLIMCWDAKTAVPAQWHISRRCRRLDVAEPSAEEGRVSHLLDNTSNERLGTATLLRDVSTLVQLGNI
jgi:hypothetical protein